MVENGEGQQSSKISGEVSRENDVGYLRISCRQ